MLLRRLINLPKKASSNIFTIIRNQRFCSNSNNVINYTDTMEWWKYHNPCDKGDNGDKGDKCDNNIIRMGLSKQAVEALSDLVYIDFDSLDYSIIYDEGDVLCEIESVKAAENLYAPMKCTVLKYNLDIEDCLENINLEPENDKNWILELEISTD